MPRFGMAPEPVFDVEPVLELAPDPEVELLSASELAEQANSSDNATAPKMTEDFMVRPLQATQRSVLEEKRDPRCLSSRGLRENDKQPGTRLVFTGFACGGENGLENHRTHGFPTRRAGLRRAGGLCAAEHVMRAPRQSIIVGSLFSDLAEITAKSDGTVAASKLPRGRTLFVRGKRRLAPENGSKSAAPALSAMPETAVAANP